jgi:hypothetical protein
MNYKLIIWGQQVNYEWTMNGLGVNYEVVDGNPCEWPKFCQQ